MVGGFEFVVCCGIVAGFEFTAGGGTVHAAAAGLGIMDSDTGMVDFESSG